MAFAIGQWFHSPHCLCWGSLVSLWKQIGFEIKQGETAQESEREDMPVTELFGIFVESSLWSHAEGLQLNAILWMFFCIFMNPDGFDREI